MRKKKMGLWNRLTSLLLAAAMLFAATPWAGAGGGAGPMLPIYLPGKTYTFSALDGKPLSMKMLSNYAVLGVTSSPTATAAITMCGDDITETDIVVDGAPGDPCEVLLSFNPKANCSFEGFTVSGIFSSDKIHVTKTSTGVQVEGMDDAKIAIHQWNDQNVTSSADLNGQTFEIADADYAAFISGQRKQLSMPTNLNYSGYTASWDAVEHATGYQVWQYDDELNVVGGPYTTTAPTYTMPQSYDEHYLFAVCAVDSTGTYLQGATIHSLEKELTPMPEAKLISFVNSTVQWEPVEGATGYTVSLLKKAYERENGEPVYAYASQSENMLIKLDSSRTMYIFRMPDYDYDEQYYVEISVHGRKGIDKYTSKVFPMQWKLPRPQNLKWENGVASWDEDKYASGYMVQIYKADGTALGDTIKTMTNSVNLSSYLTIGEKYTYKVYSCGEGTVYIDGYDSASELYEHLKNTAGGNPGTVTPTKPVTPEAPATGDETNGVDETHKCWAFTDIRGHWAQQNICNVVEKDLMNGTETTKFSPDLNMSRAMIVTVLWRMEGSPAVTGFESSFTDLKADWYKTAVNWAAQKGIVKGTSETAFRPDDNVTREQFAAIMKRYADDKGETVPGSATSASAFGDYPNVAAYAKDAMDWAVAGGLVSGKPGDKLDPQGFATRAEVATIFTRYLQNKVAAEAVE